jgi:hypothetical protein
MNDKSDVVITSEIHHVPRVRVVFALENKTGDILLSPDDCDVMFDVDWSEAAFTEGRFSLPEINRKTMES